MGSFLLALCSFLLAFLRELPWWGKLEWKVEVLWLLIEGQRKMLANFAMVIEVAFVSGTWQNKQLLDVPPSHNNHKRDPWKECYTH
jgi:hypothetical protein